MSRLPLRGRLKANAVVLLRLSQLPVHQEGPFLPGMTPLPQSPRHPDRESPDSPAPQGAWMSTSCSGPGYRMPPRRAVTRTPTSAHVAAFVRMRTGARPQQPLLIHGPLRCSDPPAPNAAILRFQTTSFNLSIFAHWYHFHAGKDNRAPPAMTPRFQIPPAAGIGPRVSGDDFTTA